MVPSISQLYLAYRQAKIALYFEQRGTGLINLARFESDLVNKLSVLRARLGRNDGWFDGIPLGEIFVVPKRLHTPSPDSTVNGSEINRIGINRNPEGDVGVDIQLRLCPTPEFAILEVLYLWNFGPAIDALSSPDVLGYRLDVRDGEIRPHSRWLFEYWPTRYQQFRMEPISIARRQVAVPDASVDIISADLESFYDTVDPSFLIKNQVTTSLSQLTSIVRTPDPDEYLVATRSLLSAYANFRRQAERKLGISLTTGIPIGCLTSRVVANASLVTLDATIRANSHVICYRRYVDDIVIVGRSEGSAESADALILRYLPHARFENGVYRLDTDALFREGSDFRLQRKKCRAHQLRGNEGDEFLRSIEQDFRGLISEHRAFVDGSVLRGEVDSQIVRTGSVDGQPIRVLRNADKVKLERFALSTALASLDKISILVERSEARRIAKKTLQRVIPLATMNTSWVEHLELSFRLLQLAVSNEDWHAVDLLVGGMDAIWGTTESLHHSVPKLYYRNQPLRRNSPWVSLRNYLHVRREETICSVLRPYSGPSPTWMQNGLRLRTNRIGRKGLMQRAHAFATADLRKRDHEDDQVPNLTTPHQWLDNVLREDLDLQNRLDQIRAFVDKCEALNDHAWQLTPAQLFLCTRPPSYFDIARRLLYRVESGGLGSEIFTDLLQKVNAIRGTNYLDAIGVVVDSSTVMFQTGSNVMHGGVGELAISSPRLILGNLVTTDQAYKNAATPNLGRHGSPALSYDRLTGLARILDKATEAATDIARQKGHSLLVLPELAVPRPWFRALARYVVTVPGLNLITGLEYLHDTKRRLVFNQAVAVFPGPFGSAATWPWTKRLPGRHEEKELEQLGVAFAPPRKPSLPRIVVKTPLGDLSVLICSELIEAKRIADLLGRAELIVVPSWNTDTASYDHLIQSVGLQLHAIIGIANNGHYSDCRVWAPRSKRWKRDLCRLIERDSNEVVYVDIPLHSLRQFHNGATSESPSKPNWRPLPPDWPH